MLDNLQDLDEKFLLAINGMNTPFLDSLMWWISGKLSWWPLYLGLIILIFLRFPWKHSLLIIGFILLLITISDQSSVHLFPNMFSIPRDFLPVNYQIISLSKLCINTTVLNEFQYWASVLFKIHKLAIFT